MTPSHLTDQPIRPLTVGDLARCADLSVDRGWHREDHKWSLLLTAGTGYGIDAPDGQGLAAACTVTRYGTAPDLAAIGMVLVAERYARQGLGRHLMTQVCDGVLKGIPLTLHATPYGRPLYEQLGFTTVGHAEMLRGSFRPEPGIDTSPVRPAVAADLPHILRLDHEVHGTDRTHLLARLPAFADQLLVSEDRTGALTGYAAAWPNTDSDVIGPLIAADVPTAKALVTALAAGTDRPLRTDIDVRHEDLVSWLTARGLESIADNTVMTRALPALPGIWTRRFAPLTVAA
ncbi:GNAT family N-acetyltransferase [Streptomyces sp. NPDC002054]|uniref:GNAT family N-acetyltransferase n=1 Tax=Streptomyces sp. NPDC002054 TaxID=3154663 RepID=UPI0033337146